MITETQFRDRLQRVFRQTFDAPDLMIDDAMGTRDIEGWDSLKHVMLILAIEEEFTVKFTTREVTTLRSVGRIVAQLRQKLSVSEVAPTRVA
jgi:acyl carrier protein